MLGKHSGSGDGGFQIYFGGGIRSVCLLGWLWTEGGLKGAFRFLAEALVAESAICWLEKTGRGTGWEGQVTRVLYGICYV